MTSADAGGLEQHSVRGTAQLDGRLLLLLVGV